MSDPSLESGNKERLSREDRLQRVRDQADDLVVDLAASLKMTREDVAAVGVVALSSYLQFSDDNETFVLLVKGRATAYNNPLEALLSASPEYESLRDELFGQADGI